jgi:DNA-dependent protein kinase catalytic subunit
MTSKSGFSAYRLDGLLIADPVIDIFVKAFSCLGEPRKMLLYFVRKLAELLDVESPNCDSLCHMYNTMMSTLFPECNENTHGAAFKHIEQYRKQLQKAEAQIKSGNKEVIKDLGTIKKGLEDLGTIKKGLEGNHVTSQQLKNYSPWLSDFQAGKYSSLDLEIPGQYTGESKPLTQHHVKIVGFGQTVSVYMCVVLLHVMF